MKSLTIKKLISLLETLDQESTVVLEGCDCASECVGYSTKVPAYEKQVILRTESGVFGREEVVVTKVNK